MYAELGDKCLGERNLCCASDSARPELVRHCSSRGLYLDRIQPRFRIPSLALIFPCFDSHSRRSPIWITALMS